MQLQIYFLEPQSMSYMDVKCVLVCNGYGLSLVVGSWFMIVIQIDKFYVIQSELPFLRLYSSSTSNL